jgi:NADH-quinone oxidoreductase subunit L
MPLIILLAAHGALQMPILDSQGSVIFLFFIWVTSTQAILTLTRLRGVASWKVSGAMLFVLLLVVFTYLFAAERFTEFLYPDRAEVAAYFKAAALPALLFDGIVVMTTVLIVFGWFYLYARTRGERIPILPWVERARASLYLVFMNSLYLDVAYSRLGTAVMRQAHRFDRSRLGRML